MLRLGQVLASTQGGLFLTFLGEYYAMFRDFMKVRVSQPSTDAIFFVKLQAKSLDLELTLFYPCHKKNKKKNKNPHQNLSERGELEG